MRERVSGVARFPRPRPEWQATPAAARMPVKRERPIPFRAEMVRAILAGAKLQTRRIVDVNGIRPGRWSHDDIATFRQDPATGRLWQAWSARLQIWSNILRSPYPLATHLWVREAWRAPRIYDDIPPRAIPAEIPVSYLAAAGPQQDGRYRHAKFMPRRFARITLALAELRCERLQSITEEDARAEGVAVLTPMTGGATSHVERYRELWESIHGRQAWDRNPWVWVISFTLESPRPG